MYFLINHAKARLTLGKRTYSQTSNGKLEQNARKKCIYKIRGKTEMK